MRKKIINLYNEQKININFIKRKKIINLYNEKKIN